MANVDISSDEIKSVLRRAQEMLKNKEKLQHQQQQPFTNSNDIILIKNEAARNLNDENKTRSSNRKSNSIISGTSTATTNQTTNRKVTKSSRSNSNLSLNDDLNISNHSQSDRLKEENELLNIKINKLRYEIKSRDQTIEDLKSNITQMYVNLENSQMALKHTHFDIETLKHDITRLNSEKVNYYDQLKKSLQDLEEKNKRAQQSQLANAELSLIVEKLKTENESLNKLNMDIKVKSLKEKEELIKHLEQIEQEIIQRERAMFNQQYEKLLIESCEKIRAEDQK